MTSSQNVYAKLKEDGYIRLVKIRGAAGGKVSCELQSFALDAEQPLDYIAISYTWGPSTLEEAARGWTSKPVRDITCNGGLLTVTENLHSFLLRAAGRPDIASRWLWIDAISIDQGNEEEKERQVNLMAEIYHSAATVLIWLGEEDQYTIRSFALARALAGSTDDELKGVTPRSLVNSRTDHTSRPITSDGSYWLCLLKLFERKYFTRAWIIQEVTLAKHRLAICGSQTISWEDIVAVSEFLTITAWTRWIASTAAYAFNHTTPNFIEANRRSMHSGAKNLVLVSIIRARRFEAADPRDKVYALLGVARAAVRGKERLEPVYGTRTVEHTYILAAMQILEDSDDLLLLAHAEGEEFRSYPNLPSWVPDWTVARAVGLGVTGYVRYSAANNVKRYLEIDEARYSLVVRGMKLDEVRAVGESKGEILRGKPFPNLLSMLCKMPERYDPLPVRMHCTGQLPAEVLSRVLITDTGGLRREHPAPPHIGAAGVAWLKSKLENAADRTEPDLLTSGLQRLDVSVGGELHGRILDEDEYEATYSHAPHLRPFATGHNYFGVGSESVKVGDSVWIVAGSRVPLLLRHTTGGDYRIVGGAYLHGFMAGDAFDAEDQFEKITIL